MNWRRYWKVLTQIGPGPIALYLRYQAGLRSGWYRWRTRRQPPFDPRWRVTFPGRFPAREALGALLDAADQRAALREADLLLEGKYRPFSGLPASLDLSRGVDGRHWAALERDLSWLRGEDIKFIWEPARFSWVFSLGRAYVLSGEARYAAAFWRLTERFFSLHPPYRGAQWMNGQEVALRLLALAWGGSLFAAPPPREEDRRRWRAALAAHAHRVSVTLTYARAQQSNHLMSEAAALWTASLLLPDHPRAASWGRTGRRWFLWAVRHHIDRRSGEYTHHSLNYHRFILQLALWLSWLEADAFPPDVQQRLGAAARWLAGLVDPHSGDAPNWGSNDGAYIFPLAGGGFRDFRPVAQAAMRAFADGPAFETGPWDEMSLWFGLPLAGQAQQPDSPFVLPWPQADARVLLRHGAGNWRLGHADFLHLDLWLRGRNLLLDAGTYLYNGPPPWDNPWPAARFHNTLTLAGHDQMTRGGRFMYLDWAAAWVLLAAEGRLIAETDAWDRLGMRHRRMLRLEGKSLHLEDWLLPTSRRRQKAAQGTVQLHFLLADWPFAVQSDAEALALRLTLPEGVAELHLPATSRWSLVRAGRAQAGTHQPDPLRGWYSPTYALKLPALSLVAEYPLPALPFSLHTVLRLP